MMMMRMYEERHRVLSVVGVKHWPTKRQHRSKLVMFITSALLLVSSLVFCFPLYLKEVTAPVTGTSLFTVFPRIEAPAGLY